MIQKLAIAIAFTLALPLQAQDLPPCQAQLPAPSKQWNHFKSSLVSRVGGPVHMAQDDFVYPGYPAQIQARFAYGPVFKSLEGETVTLWVGYPGCGWRQWESTQTNRNGEVLSKIPGDWFPQPGLYPWVAQVQGDGSWASGSVFVTRPEIPLVVFDIDGTLTTGDSQLFEEIALGQDAEMQESANQVVMHYWNQGIQPLYLTGRPRLLSKMTRRWLRNHGFPPGPVLMSPSLKRSIPSDEEVGEYKKQWLLHLHHRFQVDFVKAYGNAATDICAYARAGISPEDTYVVGPHGGTACEGYGAPHAVSDYPSHLEDLNLLQRMTSRP